MTSHCCERPQSQSLPDPAPDISESELVDPPPPYPEPHSRRHHRTSRALHIVPAEGFGQGRAHRNEEVQFSAPDSLSLYPEDDEGEANEDTPFLIPGRPRHPQTRSARHWRQRTPSQTSSTSTTISLTRTVASLFQEDENEVEGACVGVADARRHHQHRSLEESTIVDDLPSVTLSPHECACSVLSRFTWEAYFRPLRRWEYYKPLFHLLVLNFPYALIAWIYLFVFTVTGTSLLIALPLGALLLFFDLVGARAFARGEVYLQTCFHRPRFFPVVSFPLFTRYREPIVGEYERGRLPTSQGSVKETSFYKNTYAMFTDPTSYQAVFYFLVIKPAVTLLITLGLLALGVPLLILIVPAPAVLRAIRKIGIWQANIAMEGLYYAAR